MLTDRKIQSLKIEGGKRHADQDGLVLEIRPSGKVFAKLDKLVSSNMIPPM